MSHYKKEDGLSFVYIARVMSSVSHLYPHEWLQFRFIIKNTLISHYGHKCDGNKNKTLTSNRNDNPVNTCDFFKTSFYLVYGDFGNSFSEKRTFGKAKRQQNEISTSETKTLENKERGDVFIQIETRNIMHGIKNVI